MKIGGGGGGASVNRSQNVTRVTAAGQREQSKDREGGGNSGKPPQRQRPHSDKILGTNLAENQAIIDKERPNIAALAVPFPTLNQFLGGQLTLGEIKTISFSLMRLEQQLAPEKFDSVLLQLTQSVMKAHKTSGLTYETLVKKLQEFQKLMNQNTL